jgi:hypothetical protein
VFGHATLHSAVAATVFARAETGVATHLAAIDEPMPASARKVANRERQS